MFQKPVLPFPPCRCLSTGQGEPLTQTTSNLEFRLEPGSVLLVSVLNPDPFPIFLSPCAVTFPSPRDKDQRKTENCIFDVTNWGLEGRMCIYKFSLLILYVFFSIPKLIVLFQLVSSTIYLLKFSESEK